MNSLTAVGIRTEIYAADETLGKRVRVAEMQKIPYVLVVGEKEESAGEVNVRHYRRGSADAKAMADRQEGTLSLNEIAEKMKKEVDEKII